jgi:hypothetical protein
LLIGGAPPEAGAEVTAPGEQPLKRRADDRREIEQQRGLVAIGLAVAGEQLPLVELLVQQRAGEQRIAAALASRELLLPERLSRTICCTTHRFSSLNAEMN